MNLKDYRVDTDTFEEYDRVVWAQDDGPDRFGEVVGFDGPNPLVLFDGAKEEEPCSAEDLRLTAGNFPPEWDE